MNILMFVIVAMACFVAGLLVGAILYDFFLGFFNRSTFAPPPLHATICARCGARGADHFLWWEDGEIVDVRCLHCATTEMRAGRPLPPFARSDGA